MPRLWRPARRRGSAGAHTDRRAAMPARATVATRERRLSSLRSLLSASNGLVDRPNRVYGSIERLFNTASGPLALDDDDAMHALLYGLDAENGHRLLPLLKRLRAKGMRIERATCLLRPFRLVFYLKLRDLDDASFAWVNGLLTAHETDVVERDANLRPGAILAADVVHTLQRNRLDRALAVLRIYTEDRSYDGSAPVDAMNRIDACSQRNVMRQHPHAVVLKTVVSKWSASRLALLLTNSRLLQRDGDHAVGRLIRDLGREME